MKQLIQRAVWPVYVYTHRNGWPLAVRVRLQRVLIWAGNVYL